MELHISDFKLFNKSGVLTAAEVGYINDVFGARLRHNVVYVHPCRLVSDNTDFVVMATKHIAACRRVLPMPMGCGNDVPIYRQLA